MSFSRRSRLGFFLIDDLLEAASAVKGVGSLVSNASGMFDSGKSTDQKRLARANFFRDSALAGSVTAGRYLLGGLANVAGNEKPYYTAAWAQLVGDPTGLGEQVSQEATAQGALWNTSDVAGDPSKSAMIADVQTDLKAIGKQVAAPTTTVTTTGTSTTTSAVPLQAMHSTAPFNWTPIVIGGGLGLAALVLSRKH